MVCSEEEYETLEQAKLENAKAEARDEGMKQGIEQEKIKVAKNMLKKHIDIKVISEITRLSIKEINNLE